VFGVANPEDGANTSPETSVNPYETAYHASQKTETFISRFQSLLFTEIYILKLRIYDQENVDRE
jgi:hypothetical protein